MDDELLIYSGGGDIRINNDTKNKNLTDIEKKKKRLKERISAFTKELKRLEELEKNDKSNSL